MKVAIISDVHGNMEALGALPDNFDELWVLGDLVNYGPDPDSVVDFIEANADVVVQGNHDHAIAFNENPRCSKPFREMAHAMKQYTRSVLSHSQEQFLRQLPLQCEREIEGLRVLLCHAMPSDPLFAYCPPDSAQWRSELEESGADVLLVGHTHIPFVREFNSQTVANPGSLGQPKTGSPAARYAVWDTTACPSAIELRFFEYPFEKTIEKINALPIRAEIRAGLADVLRHGGLNDQERT